MDKKKTSRGPLIRLAALLVVLLWGSLYPGVKLGYRYLSINTSRVQDIMMFAGNRFLVCGTIITALTFGRGDRLDARVKASLWPVISMGFTGVVLHYPLAFVFICSGILVGGKQNG